MSCVNYTNDGPYSGSIEISGTTCNGVTGMFYLNFGETICMDTNYPLFTCDYFKINGPCNPPTPTPTTTSTPSPTPGACERIYVEFLNPVSSGNTQYMSISPNSPAFLNLDPTLSPVFQYSCSTYNSESYIAFTGETTGDALLYYPTFGQFVYWDAPNANECGEGGNSVVLGGNFNTGFTYNGFIYPANGLSINSLMYLTYVGSCLPAPTITPTISPSSTPTCTPTLTSTPTTTPTATFGTTPSVTPSNTATPSITPSQTTTNTPSPSVTPTLTKTPTNTPSNTPTFTPTATVPLYRYRYYVHACGSCIQLGFSSSELRTNYPLTSGYFYKWQDENNIFRIDSPYSGPTLTINDKRFNYNYNSGSTCVSASLCTTPTPTPSNTPTSTPQVTPTTTATNTPTPSETPPATGTTLYIYGKYINSPSSGDLEYSINSGTVQTIGPISTTSCDFITSIAGLSIGDSVEFTDSSTNAIAGSTTVCPSGPGGFSCQYNHSVLSSGSEFAYITVDGSSTC
jgi:hypothetical protein